MSPVLTADLWIIIAVDKAADAVLMGSPLSAVLSALPKGGFDFLSLSPQHPV